MQVVQEARIDEADTDQASLLGPASLIDEQLESARARIEARFYDAGARLAASLEIVGSLIASLDHLGAALTPAEVSRTSADLRSMADDLSALPSAQTDRILRLEQLREANAIFGAHMAEMRQTMRYLRAFVMYVKITAGGVLGSGDEFAHFAGRMTEQLDFGGGKLDELTAYVDQLDSQLSLALTFEQTLSERYRTVIPAVPDKLAVDAESISRHHARVADVTASVARIAREIQAKVAGALTALQIGDMTRQRIEHVQLGLQVTARTLAASDLSPEARDRAERRLMHLMADQMFDIAARFQAEAGKINHNLEGMAADTHQILVMGTLSDGNGGNLRELETGLEKAVLLVENVGAAVENAHRIGDQTLAIVAALTQRVDAVQRVKMDIQEMAINSSLRCKRLGELGRPLNVIALQLGNQAADLEQSADQSMHSLTALARIAEAAPVQAGEAGMDASRLYAVRDRLQSAASVIEADLADLAPRGEEAARALGVASAHLALKQELGDVLDAAASALAKAAGAPVDDLSDISSLVGAVMDQMARSYTMASERTIHAAHAIAGPVDATPPEETAPTAAEDEFDDILF